jgi:hypothetical protein
MPLPRRRHHEKETGNRERHGPREGGESIFVGVASRRGSGEDVQVVPTAPLARRGTCARTQKARPGGSSA